MKTCSFDFIFKLWALTSLGEPLKSKPTPKTDIINITNIVEYKVRAGLPRLYKITESNTIMDTRDVETSYAV